MTYEEIKARYKDNSTPFNGLMAFIIDWSNGDRELVEGLLQREYASFQVDREEEYQIFAVFELFNTDDLEWEERIKPSIHFIHRIVNDVTIIIASEIIAYLNEKEEIQTAKQESE